MDGGKRDERGRKEMKGRIQQLCGFEWKTTVQIFSLFFFFLKPEQISDSIFLFTVTATGRVWKGKRGFLYEFTHAIHILW